MQERAHHRQTRVSAQSQGIQAKTARASVFVGGIGLNQSAYVFVFSLVGVPEQKSLAVSLFMQALIIVSSLPGGVLWWRKRSSEASE